MQKRFIAYIIAMIAVLVVVFLSQQQYFREKGESLMSNISDTAGAYLSKGSSWASGWVTSNIYSRIGGEAQNRGDLIQNKVEQTSGNISESSKNTTEKIQNYFSGISDSVLHPEENNNCQPSQTSTNQ